MQINTVQQFAEACKTLDNNGIYDLFEDVISDELREEIYEFSAGIITPEPTRCAFINIGIRFNVESLVNY